MKTTDWFILFAVVLVASTAANLIALKIVADEMSAAAAESPLGRLANIFN